MTNSDPFFPPIGTVADKAEIDSNSASECEDRPLEEIESLCMRCGKLGMTRMLLTSIPFFREVIVMSFHCEECGNTNNEIQSAGEIKSEGTIHTARILSRLDLNRQIVRSSACSIIIPELELTLPASRGQLTTVEGLVRDIVSDLSMDQPLRRYRDEESFAKIEALLDKLKAILGDPDSGDEESQPTPAAASFPAFTVQLDDPTGNSFIEFVGTMADHKWNMRTYRRTHQQDIDLGLASPDDQALIPKSELESTTTTSRFDETGQGEALGRSSDEVYIFPGVCSSCRHSLETRMKKVVIPYFKEGHLLDILIMSTNCDICGYRDNEVKSGSAISDQGKRITLKVQDREDLSRDILKSETAGMTVPEIDLVLHAGTLGGRFTTLEGILEQVYEELSEKVFVGDSASSDPIDRITFENFLSELRQVKSGGRKFTLILDDPLANSYIQNIYAPDPDPNLMVEMYDRTWQQNEDLGLNDMNVEDYQEQDTPEEVLLPTTPSTAAPTNI